MVTLNISPAPSQSLAVMIGGVDVEEALLLEEARGSTGRRSCAARAMAPKVLVRGRRWAMVRRNSNEWPFFCSG